MVDDFPSPSTIAELLGQLTLEQKVRLLTGADFWGLNPEPAIGLRRVLLSDGPAGVRGERWDEREPSANVPSPTALAATWDRELVAEVGSLLGAEARRKNVDVLLAPTINLHRTPYGGRHFECFSEDPHLTAEIGVAYVEGVQSQGVAATAKHFVANDSETERFTLDARVDDRTLRELYLAPFEALVKAGVWAVMAAYNGVNGVTMTESPLLRTILHDEWSFDGVTMTDWTAGRSIEAAKAGLDLIMPGPEGPWGAALVEAVRSGVVAEDVLDDKVARLLRLAGRVGGLGGFPEPALLQGWPPKESAALLRRAASASFVLAKNASPNGSPMLPLDRSNLGSVVVIGSHAAAPRTLGGGSATVFPPYVVTPLAGLEFALPAGVPRYLPGCRTSSRHSAAPTAVLSTADGERGVVVTYSDADGLTLGSEVRDSSTFMWIAEAGDGIAVTDIATIDLTTRVTVERSGQYWIGASGLGSLRLSVGGTIVVEEVASDDAGDPVESMSRPPQRVAAIDLVAGAPVDVQLRCHRAAVGGGGPMVLPLAVLQFLLEPLTNDDHDIGAAVAAAAQADVVLVVVGTSEDVESEGFDRENLSLPGRQDELVARVAEVNPRTIVVVNSGSPVLMPWAEQVAALVLTWFPGQEFGNALADVILGVREPGGRLPVTWPSAEEGLPSTVPVDGVLSYEEGLFVGYKAYDRDGRSPAFCFGHGLGYTTWDYRGMRVEDDSDGSVKVFVDVFNTGSRSGSEVVQVYLAQDSSSDRPRRWLAGWSIVAADPGQQATAEVRIGPRAFASWQGERGWVRSTRLFEVHAGRSIADLPIHVGFTPVAR